LDRSDNFLKRFWELESFAEPIIRATKEELNCVWHVALSPARDYLDLLKETYQLDSRPSLSSLIKEYLDLRHMSLVSAVDSLTQIWLFSQRCAYGGDLNLAYTVPVSFAPSYNHVCKMYCCVRDCKEKSYLQCIL